MPVAVGQATSTLRPSIGFPFTSFAVTKTASAVEPERTPTHFTDSLSDPTCGAAPVPCEIAQITSARSPVARRRTLPVMSLTLASSRDWFLMNSAYSGAKYLREYAAAAMAFVRMLAKP